MGILRDLFHFLEPILFVLFGLVLFIILFSIIDALIMSPKRRKEINEALKVQWLPNKKYIYIILDSLGSEADDDAFRNFVNNELIPKYKKYLVVDSYAKDMLAGSDFKDSANLILTEYALDHDCALEISMVTIGRDLKLTNYWTVYKTDSEDDPDVEATKKLFTEKIEECLDEWGVLKSKNTKKK